MNTKPQIMGVINMTPNSFQTIGKFQEAEPAIAYAMRLIEEGADIIDIGGEATNPIDNSEVSLEQELARVIPVIEGIRRLTDIPISVDTSKPLVMQAAIAAGANIINDIRALRLPGALAMAVQLQVPVCLMHKEPEVKTSNVVAHVKKFLQERAADCLAAGILKENIIIDPGIGGGIYGKTAEQNLQLIKNTAAFTRLGYPLLIGVSFKIFIEQTLGLKIPERSHASLAAAVYAAEHGANILRVHEVLKTKQALDILEAIIVQREVEVE